MEHFWRVGSFLVYRACFHARTASPDPKNVADNEIQIATAVPHMFLMSSDDEAPVATAVPTPPPEEMPPTPTVVPSDDRTGQNRTEQDKTGQDRTEQE